MAAERHDPFADPGAHADPEPGAEIAVPIRGEPDYYAALGLRPGASSDDIRHAFHRLAKLWHPDRYMAAAPELRARAERRMRALTAAHDVLGDPVRRRVYDLRHGYPAPDAPDAPAAVRSASPAARVAYRPAPHSRAYAADPTLNTRGAGIFLALVLGIPALSILIYSLTHAGDGFGSSVALIISLILFAVAAWCLADDSPPARIATRWMESDPRPPEPVTAPPSTSAADTEPAAEPTPFERLVDEALTGVPREFRSYCENVAVTVRPEPTPEQLREMHVREGHTLFGLYEGAPLTSYRAWRAGPERITIFQGPIERFCNGDPDAMREQVRRTVLHELAHHFGIDHEDMPDWVR